MTLIDLGELTDTDLAQPAPVNHRRLLRAVLALVSAAGLGVAGGSVRPAPPALETLWSAPLGPDEEVGFSPDTAYRSRVVRGRREITAYDLDTGRPGWTALLDDRGPTVPATVDGVLLLRLGEREVRHKIPDGTSMFTFHQTTVAMDGATGAEIWRAPGQPAGQTGSEVLLENRDESGRLASLTLRRARTGWPVWSHDTPGIRDWVATGQDGRPAQVITVSGDNRVTRYRFADGSVLGRGRLPAGPVQVGTIGGYLTSTRSVEAGGAKVATTVHDPASLAPLWSVDTTDRQLMACGPVICRSGPGDTAGLDPATGRELWHRSEDLAPRPTSDRYLLLEGDGDPHRTIDDGHFPNGPVYVVVDATTGRPRGTAGRGRVLWQAQPADTTVVLQPPAVEPGRTQVIHLDLDTGRPRLLGPTDITFEAGCIDLGRYLACQDVDRLTVMAVG